MNKLIRLYTDILTSADIEIADGGILMYREKPDADPVPVTVTLDRNERQIILPTEANLKAGITDDYVVFHPACESVFCGHSVILNRLQLQLNLKLYYATLVAVDALLQLANSREEHGKLDRKQQALIMPLSDISKSTIDYFRQVVRKITGVSGKHPLLSLHLARNRQVDGVVFGNVCTLQTPILSEKDPFYGINTAKKNHEPLRVAFETVFPEDRAIGTNSRDTPCLDVLLGMYVKTARHLNALKATLGKKYSGNMKTIDISWFDELKNLKAYKDKYAPGNFPGNKGTPLQKKAGSANVGNVDIPAPSLPNQSGGKSLSERLSETERAVPEMPKQQEPLYEPAPPQPMAQPQMPAPNYAVPPPPQPSSGGPMSLTERMMLEEQAAVGRGVMPYQQAVGYYAMQPQPAVQPQWSPQPAMQQMPMQPMMQMGQPQMSYGSPMPQNYAPVATNRMGVPIAQCR